MEEWLHEDFMYIKDTARVCVEIMKKLEGTVNIGSNKIYSIKNVVEKLASIYDMHHLIEWDASKPNGQEYRSYELSRIDGIGFSCRYSLLDGLKETVEWYASSQEYV